MTGTPRDFHGRETKSTIQKMNRNQRCIRLPLLLINFTIISLAILFAGCASAPKTCKIGGQILVSDNGKIQPTGKAPIWIYDATNSQLTVCKPLPNFGGRSRQDWKRIVEEYPNSLNARSNYMAAVQNASSAELKYRDVNEKFWQKKNALNGQTNGPDFELVKQLEVAVKAALEEKDLAWDKDDDARELIFYWYGVNPEILYAGLPTPVALAQTDTNGNFNIELPKSKKVLLAIHTEGTVDGMPGDYFWLTPVTASEAKSSHLVLNGENSWVRKPRPVQPVIILPEPNGYIGNIGSSKQIRLRDRGTPY